MKSLIILIIISIKHNSSIISTFCELCLNLSLLLVVHSWSNIKIYCTLFSSNKVEFFKLKIIFVITTLV